MKEHVLANMSFMSYAQVKVFTRKVGIEQLHTYHFIEKGMFLQYVFKQSALCLIARLISSQQRRPTRPNNRSSSSNPLLLLPPKKKNQGALNQVLRIATTE